MMAKTYKGRVVAPDSTQVMLHKNDQIKEEHAKELKKIRMESQRSNDDLDKQVISLW